MRLSSPVLLCCCVLVTGCATGLEVNAALTESLSLPVEFDNARPEVLEVQFYRGFMVVQEGPVLECQLNVDLTGASRPELNELRGHLRPTIEEAADGSLTKMRLGLPPGGRLDSIQTRYLLRVPREVKLVVRTREGSVYLRDFGGQVDVEGGQGVIEAELQGGTAVLSTESGSITLRGHYIAATLRSATGRIRVSLPPDPATPVDVHVRSISGETSLDLPEERAFALRYLGDPNLLRADSLVELDWIEVGEEDGEDFLIARVGPEEEPVDGQIFVRTGTGLVRLRRLLGTRP